MIAIVCSTLETPDDKAFILRIYQEYKHLMFGTAWKYTSSPQDCEDIVQESLVRLIDKIDYFRHIERCVLPAYIVSTVRNTAINHLKHQAAVQKHKSGLNEQQLSEDVLEFSDLAQLLHHREQVSKIWTVLTDEERFLLEGKYIIGYTDQELAKHLKCKASSIRMKLTRTRRKAFQFLKQQEEGELDE